MNHFQHLFFILFPIRWIHFFGLTINAPYFKSRFMKRWKIYIFFCIFFSSKFILYWCLTINLNPISLSPNVELYSVLNNSEVHKKITPKKSLSGNNWWYLLGVFTFLFKEKDIWLATNCNLGPEQASILAFIPGKRYMTRHKSVI